MRTICNICWPGLPKNSVENIVDLFFHGRIATIQKAWFISPGKVRDFTSFFQGALNHIHLATGKKELDFSNTDLVKTFERFVKMVDNQADIVNGRLHISVFNNNGIENHSFSLLRFIKVRAIEPLLESKSRRLLVDNQKSKITRERYELKMPKIGLFSHLY